MQLDAHTAQLGPLRALSRVWPGPKLALALVVVLALLPTTASAAPTLETDPAYTSSALTCTQLGQSDNNGVFYSTCGTRLIRFDMNGVGLADIPLPAGINQPRDVAPSPDGAFLYISQGTLTPRRLNRQGDGTYVLDPAWKLEQFLFWNVAWTPIGHSLATDGRGDIYVSNGSYWASGNTQTSIAKYRPDGTSITAFGDYGKEDGNWIVNMDVAVSRDGRRVYVGENCGRACNYTDPNYQGSRVTRYDFTPGGTYRFTRIVSSQEPMDGNAFPRCQSAGATHSAYSLSLDFWDNLYVTSTTCGRLQMFATNVDPAKDVFVKSVVVYTDPATATGIQGIRNHYVASDWAGRLYANEWRLKFTPNTIRLPAIPLPALEPLPTPDLVAPILTNITMPPVTTTQDVTVAIAATDDRGVTELQLAREDGTWGPWQPFTTPVSFRLSDGFGVKGVYVRVRDMAGNESNAVYRTVSFRGPVDPAEPPPPVGDIADPVLVSVSGPALTATRDIQIEIVATDDTAVRQVRFANEDGNWNAWQVFAASTTWTLTATQGPKLVYVQVRDGAGRESGVRTVPSRFALDAPPPPPPGQQPDATAPVLAALTLPAETTTQAVAAVLVATDEIGVAQIRFANEDGNWTGWRAFTSPSQWTLSAGFGGKLVYAQVRDAAGNESLVLTARTSYVRALAGPVDAQDPALTAITLPAVTPTVDVEVALTASDDIAVTQVRFANEDGNWGAWRAFAPRVPHTLTAGNTVKLVYAQVRDAAGRESNVLFARTQVTP